MFLSVSFIGVLPPMGPDTTIPRWLSSHIANSRFQFLTPDEETAKCKTDLVDIEPVFVRRQR